MTGGPRVSATAAREREEAGWRRRVGPVKLSWAATKMWGWNAGKKKNGLDLLG
jgi:hypothetical protein